MGIDEYPSIPGLLEGFRPARLGGREGFTWFGMGDGSRIVHWVKAREGPTSLGVSP